MKIGEVATAAEVTVDTIRYYERRGVIPPPQRRPSGYRDYEPAIVERIRMARRLQQMGLTLAEIIDALHAHDEGTATCESERWRLDVVLERIDRQIAELTALRQSIHRARARCDGGDCMLLRSGPPTEEGTGNPATEY